MTDTDVNAQLYNIIGNKTLKKGALFTDIHFGKKANSITHNEDCLQFIDFFCDQVNQRDDIDYLAFLGDWHESRSSINISTLKYSYEGAKKLNDLGLPLFFIVGNHDLYYRHSREIHSLDWLNEFENIIVIDQPIVVDQIEGSVLFSPYIFQSEYDHINETGCYDNIPVWMGHFEFKGFVVTGYNILMPTGPEVSDYNGPTHILSGHFHKRQQQNNIIYIGNTFPMDFGDAGDIQRGMCLYDNTTNDLQYIDWPECPKYIKTTLTKLMNDETSLYKHARVKCICDKPIDFEESKVLEESFTEQYELREFVLEENDDVSKTLTETEAEVDFEDENLATVNDLVIEMLTQIESEKVDQQLLINCYNNIEDPSE